MSNEKRAPGRPPKADSPAPDVRAKQNLQYALDRACAFIGDHPTTSYVARAGRAARVGIPVETVTVGLDAMQQAITEAREAIAAVYAAPKARKATLVSRVEL